MKTSEALARMRGAGKPDPKDKTKGIAALINIEHRAVEASFKDAMVHAIAAGELLVRAKALVKHGDWLPWVGKYCDCSERTARVYMQMAGNRQRAADLSIRQNLKLLVGAEDVNPLFSKESQEWYTPSDIIERVQAAIGPIELDPCSDGKTVPADAHFTAKDDGLAQTWAGKVYMNPPYGDAIKVWVEKLCAEYAAGNVTEAIALVPARVDTEWFRMFRDFAVCFVNGRLKFSGHENSAPFPSALVYLGKNLPGFYLAMNGLGDVWARVRERSSRSTSAQNTETLGPTHSVE